MDVNIYTSFLILTFFWCGTGISKGNTQPKMENIFTKYRTSKNRKYLQSPLDARTFRVQHSQMNRFMHLQQNIYKNSRIKKAVSAPRQLSSMDKLSNSNQLSQCAVLDNTCRCYNDPNTNRSNINCRYFGLYDVPRFQSLDVVYYQITFSEGNTITSLPDNAFQNLKVERIDLLKNYLTEIRSGAFNGLEDYLQELLLEGNGPHGIEVPFMSIYRLKRLRRLTLKNFRLGNLNASNYFGFFPNLEVLSFMDLSLKHIDGEAFKDKLTNLRSLYFEDVELNYIPVASLVHLTNLRTLHIQGTKITTIYSRSFETMGNLEDLKLYRNSIRDMEADAFYRVSDQLKSLDLSSNDLAPRSLEALSSKQWKNLEYLYLSYNGDLENIPENVFRFMPKLQYLYLDNINLRHVSGNLFAGLDNLFALDLSWNNIQTIDDQAFLHLGNMNELKINHQFEFGPVSATTKLELMPNQLRSLNKNLVMLDLSSTKLQTLSFWSAIGVLTELRELKLGNAGLKDIPIYAFAKNTKLKKLHLDRNGITYLNHAAFRGLEQTLIDLELDFNNLSTISHCVFANFTQLQFVHLNANPLYCDCRLQWLHTMIHKDLNKTAFYKNEFNCSKPVNLQGRLLYDLPASELTCNVNIPEICNFHETDAPTTNKPTSTTPKVTVKPPIPNNELKLTIASTLEKSLTVAWKVTHDEDITGFELEFRLTTQAKMGKPINIHRNEFIYTLNFLQPGTFYYICVTAEVQQQLDYRLKDCTTAQTLSRNTDTGKQNGGNDVSASGMDRNTTIGVVLAVAVVVILLITGFCAIVRYKLQKVKEIGRTLERMQSPYDRHLYYDASKTGRIVEPNEYSHIDEAQISCKYQVKNPRMIQRQFGIDNQGFDPYSDINPYYHVGTYQIAGYPRRARKNPYENDDEEEFDQKVSITDESTVHYKSGLDQRHSAPSRLDAVDLKRHSERNSRPLPATPAELTKPIRCSTLKTGNRQLNTRKQEPFITLATIHDSTTKTSETCK